MSIKVRVILFLFYLLYSNIMINFDTNDGIYKSPCTMMMISITTSEDTDDIGEGNLELTLQYHQNIYREILNTRAYTSETFLGQVGGLVGM